MQELKNSAQFKERTSLAKEVVENENGSYSPYLYIAPTNGTSIQSGIRKWERCTAHPDMITVPGKNLVTGADALGVDIIGQLFFSNLNMTADYMLTDELLNASRSAEYKTEAMAIDAYNSQSYKQASEIIDSLYYK